VDLDIQVSRFDLGRRPSGIGSSVSRLASAADGVGIKTMSFLPHFFQMERMAPAEDPMLEGYTALGFVAGPTERLRLRLLVGCHI